MNIVSMSAATFFVLVAAMSMTILGTAYARPPRDYGELLPVGAPAVTTTTKAPPVLAPVTPNYSNNNNNNNNNRQPNYGQPNYDGQERKKNSQPNGSGVYNRTKDVEGNRSKYGGDNNDSNRGKQGGNNYGAKHNYEDTYSSSATSTTTTTTTTTTQSSYWPRETIEDNYRERDGEGNELRRKEEHSRRQQQPSRHNQEQQQRRRGGNNNITSSSSSTTPTSTTTSSSGLGFSNFSF